MLTVIDYIYIFGASRRALMPPSLDLLLARALTTNDARRRRGSTRAARRGHDEKAVANAYFTFTLIIGRPLADKELLAFKTGSLKRIERLMVTTSAPYRNGLAYFADISSCWPEFIARLLKR